jgi:hypothetical protein
MARGVKGTGEHGGSGTLYNGGCKCEPCVVAHRKRMAVLRTARWAQRVIGEDGYWFHPFAPNHNRSTYNNYGCRCAVCRADHSAYMETVHEKRRGK